MGPICGSRICVRRLHSASVMDKCRSPSWLVMLILTLGAAVGLPGLSLEPWPSFACHQLAQIARAVQAPTGGIRTETLRNSFEPLVHRAVDQLPYTSRD